MLRFFQNIRRNLVNNKNLKRYLIYALGEILLIMTGIILALQINNWNANRIDKKNEKLLGHNISEDLLTDYQNIQTLLKQAKLKQDIHLRLYNESIVDANSGNAEPYSSAIVETTSLISKTWDNHNGSVDNISNTEIRAELNEYFRNFQTFQEYSTSLNGVILNELRPYFRNNDLINFQAVFESDPNQDNIDRFNFFNNEKLHSKFGTREFNGLVLELYLNTQDVIQWLEVLSENNTSLRSMLETTYG